MNVLLASTSTLFGGNYLEYLTNEIISLFDGVDEIIFIPFARPGGISHDEYTKKVQDFFADLNISVKGLHEFDDKVAALNSAKGFFTGGGNTFLLVKTLHDENLMQVLKENVEKGKPYLGSSAGSNIGGINMKTTNDMPIVYPPSFDCMGLVPFNLNPHYLDANPVGHAGETREQRIEEFIEANPDIYVAGLREGCMLLRENTKLTLIGSRTLRLFKKVNLSAELSSDNDLSFLLK